MAVSGIFKCVRYTRSGPCWTAPNAKPTIKVSCSGAQLYSDANGTVPFNTAATHSFSNQLTLYLVATVHSFKGVTVSATAWPNCDSYSSSGQNSSSGSNPHAGHNFSCSDSDTGTAWEVKITGPDTKVVGQSGLVLRGI